MWTAIVIICLSSIPVCEMKTSKGIVEGLKYENPEQCQTNAEILLSELAPMWPLGETLISACIIDL